MSWAALPSASWTALASTYGGVLSGASVSFLVCLGIFQVSPTGRDERLRVIQSLTEFTAVKIESPGRGTPNSHHQNVRTRESSDDEA